MSIILTKDFFFDIISIIEERYLGRKKIAREYTFKPKTKVFAPYNPMQTKNYEEIILLHEEIEAIFLMDFLNLYQEDAATKMNISRPTFSRILKNARQKIASSIIIGKKLIINDEKKSYIIATCSNSKENFDNATPKERYIVILKIDNQVIKEIKFYENPANEEDSKPGKILPKFLKEREVNFFIIQSIGEGLENILTNSGIFCIKKKIEDIKEIIKY